ncbi:MAG: hypothetical protein Ct9H300mP20_19990 [Gammaproteobacteria bacterium]|nr:MAG: hypothetical protein Ct9H300mP20_19990 [Gammaproteobacteria bacterium]
MNKLFKIAVLALFLAPFSVFAADEVEEVVVTGSQIKGAKITVLYQYREYQTQTLKRLGVDSGDDLLKT